MLYWAYKCSGRDYLRCSGNEGELGKAPGHPWLPWSACNPSPLLTTGEPTLTIGARRDAGPLAMTFFMWLHVS